LKSKSIAKSSIFLLFGIFIFSNYTAYAETYRLEIDENVFDIEYELDGDVIAMATDKETISLLIATENVEDSEFVIEVDGVIPALGQESDWACLDSGCACTLSDWGTINVNPFTLRTNDPEIFAGGDAVTGPKSLIEATASGRKAAINIDRFINHLPVEPDEDDHFKTLFESIKIYRSDEEIGKKIKILNRKQPPKLPPETRLSTFDEVEQCFSSSDAVAEAERCLRCYYVITVAV